MMTSKARRCLAVTLGGGVSMALILLMGGVPSPSNISAPFSASATTQQSSAASKGRRPNIILISADDMSTRDLRYMSRTKRLIERRGVSFEGISPHPLCCPARAELLTGQFAQNNGVRTNTGKYGSWKRLDPSSTVATWLESAGYNTGFVGKFLNQYRERNAQRRDMPGWTSWNPLVNQTYNYNEFDLWQDGRAKTYRRYQTNFLTRVGSQTIQKFSREDKPFYLWMSYIAPHGECKDRKNQRECWGPPTPAKQDSDKFPNLPLYSVKKLSFNEQDMSDKPSIIRNADKYTGKKYRNTVRSHRKRVRSLQSLDRGVKRLFKTLRRTNSLKDTVVVFTSDNGYLLGEHRYTGKVLGYEESFQVPLIIRGPGFPSNKQVDSVATTVDIAPTIAALGNANPSIKVDALDLKPVGHGANSWSTLLVQAGPESRAEEKGTGWLFRGVRTSRYTYLRYRNTGEAELYDRKRDPYQLRSVHDDRRYTKVEDELNRRTRALVGCEGSSCERRFKRKVPNPRPR